MKLAGASARLIFAARKEQIMKKRTGFTLVELLVVIAIIGMLMALLLPAVQNARETGRRAVCLNNMKQVSIALRGYEAAKKELPGYANAVAGRNVPWTMTLFPYMERTDVWQRWSDTTTSVAVLQQSLPYMELLLCPSNPPVDQQHPWTSFVANCGKRDVFPYRSVPPVSPSNATDYANAEKSPNGVFFNKNTANSVAPAPLVFSRLSMSLDHIPDGASSTLMVSENLQAFKYQEDDPTHATSATTQLQYSPAWHAEQANGFVWDPAGTTKVINSNKNTTSNGDPYTDPGNYTYSRPSSNHPGGVNVAMCGGELFFMKEDIDYWVYQQLMTTDGKHSDMVTTAIPGSSPAVSVKDYILNDADYK
jgi:prepilin-type N-terminal cleavage/methylation domain-containing protein